MRIKKNIDVSDYSDEQILAAIKMLELREDPNLEHFYKKIFINAVSILRSHGEGGRYSNPTSTVNNILNGFRTMLTELDLNPEEFGL
jgi:hypothetical protein